MPPHVTFWSEQDKEYVCTFLDEGLKGLSGLGSELHIAKYELEVAYLTWVSVIRAKNG